jgi:hypothetical protein
LRTCSKPSIHIATPKITLHYTAVMSAATDKVQEIVDKVEDVAVTEEKPEEKEGAANAKPKSEKKTKKAKAGAVAEGPLVVCTTFCACGAGSMLTLGFYSSIPNQRISPNDSRFLRS